MSFVSSWDTILISSHKRNAHYLTNIDVRATLTLDVITNVFIVVLGKEERKEIEKDLIMSFMEIF